MIEALVGTTGTTGTLVEIGTVIVGLLVILVTEDPRGVTTIEATVHAARAMITRVVLETTEAVHETKPEMVVNMTEAVLVQHLVA